MDQDASADYTQSIEPQTEDTSHASTPSSSSHASDRTCTEERASRKRKRPRPPDPVDAALLAALGQMQSTTISPEDTEATLIGKQVAETAARFTRRQTAWAKIKIAELLFDIEYGYPDQQ